MQLGLRENHDSTYLDTPKVLSIHSLLILRLCVVFSACFFVSFTCYLGESSWITNIITQGTTVIMEYVG
jgi:hypothetical protein